MSRRNSAFASSSSIISLSAFPNFFLVNSPVDNVTAVKSHFLSNSAIWSSIVVDLSS